MTQAPAPDDWETVRRWGANPSCFQVLRPELERFHAPGGGLVGYADTGRAWVCVGEPIGPQHSRADTLSEFSRAAARAKRRVRWFATEDSGLPGCRSVCIGEHALWLPSTWPARARPSLREQWRRARAKGVVVGRGLDDLAAVDSLVAAWRRSLPLAEFGFFAAVDVHANAHARRYWRAVHQGRLVGLLVAAPIEARDGWCLEHMIRATDAPNGTVELLLNEAMIDWAEEGVEYVTTGLCPLSSTDQPVMEWIGRHTELLYHFHGLRAFWHKHGPTHWRPLYLCYPSDDTALSAVHDCLTAFAGNHLGQFAGRTVAHLVARQRERWTGQNPLTP